MALSAYVAIILLLLTSISRFGLTVAITDLLITLELGIELALLKIDPAADDPYGKPKWPRAGG